MSVYWQRFLCLVFGHRLHVKQHFTKHSRRVVCLCCDGDWAMNDDVRSFLKWDSEFEELYKTLGHRILK